MKKIFVCFLSVLTIYHFLYSSIFSVYASEFDENTVTDQIDFEMPLIYDTPQFYSATLTLGSMAIGGATVMTAPIGLGAYLIGAVVIGVGTYFMLQGHSSLSLDDIYTDLPTNIKSEDIEVEENGDITISPSTSSRDFYINQSVGALYKNDVPPFSSPSVGNVSGYGIHNNLKEFGFVLDQITYYNGTSFRFKHSDMGYSFVIPVYNDRNLSKLVGYYISESSTSFVYFKNYDGKYSYFDGISGGYSFYNTNGVKTNYYGTGYVTNGFELSSSKNYTSSSILSSFGAFLMSQSQTSTFISQLKTSSMEMEYTVPLSQLALANPDLTYNINDNCWYNSSGEKVDPLDVVMPLPNTLTNDKLTFDDVTQSEIDNAINGETDIPSGDGSIGGIGWLSSVLNAIMSLPSLIANAFSSLFETIVNAIKSIPDAIGLFIDNVIIAVQSIPNALSGMFDNVVGAVQSIPNALSGVLGGISTGINNTWEWCKGLPNVLGELLGALGSAIVDGLTLAFGGVISGIQTIVDFFVGILDFVMSLVIPSDGFFSSELSKLGDVFNSKFPFFSQIGDILNAFKFDINAPLPEFKITVPIKFGGGTYNVINFAHFVSYRQYILNFVRLFTWIPFLMRIYKKSMYMATGK